MLQCRSGRDAFLLDLDEGVIKMEVEWWMYFTHAFSPLLVKFFTESTSRQADNPQDNVDPGVVGNLLGVLIFSAFFYLLWAGIHWLVFWVFDIKFLFEEFFFKPISVPYLAPYIIGAGFVVYQSKLDRFTNKNWKSGVSLVFAIFLIAAIYMILVTYIKWLHLCLNS